MPPLERTRLLPTSLAVLVAAGTAGAQLRHDRVAPKAVAPRELPMIVVPADATRFDREDGRRFGVPLAVTCDVPAEGDWRRERIEGAPFDVCRVALCSPGAKSMMVQFDRFELPPEGALFLRSEAGELVFGGVMNDGAFEGRLVTQPFPGSVVVVEVATPAGAEPPRVSIEGIVHDFAGVLEARASSARSSGCSIDVNCAPGLGYQDVKRAVVETLLATGPLAGLWACSGVLVNNTAEDGTPYLYSAGHCNPVELLFVFGYENSLCRGTDAAPLKSIYGARRLVTAPTDKEDGRLHLLSSAPPPDYRPYYAGWTRTTRPRGPMVNIGHPFGEPKSISVDHDDPYTSARESPWSNVPWLKNTSYWWEVEWEQGLSTNGNSGSPLLDRDKRVCANFNYNDWFATCRGQAAFKKFHLFYDNYGLARWLDPLGLDPLAIDGLEPFPPAAVRYDGGIPSPAELESAGTLEPGTVWRPRVAARRVPGRAVRSFLSGWSARSAGQLRPFGELLVDPGSLLLFRDAAPFVGARAEHAVALPSTPEAAGWTVFAQALVEVRQGRRSRWVATNGLELRLH